MLRESAGVWYADSSPTDADRKCSCKAVLPRTGSVQARRYFGRVCRACRSEVYLGRRLRDGSGGSVLNLALNSLPCAPMDMHTALLTLVWTAEVGIDSCASSRRAAVVTAPGRMIESLRIPRDSSLHSFPANDESTTTNIGMKAGMR